MKSITSFSLLTALEEERIKEFSHVPHAEKASYLSNVLKREEKEILKTLASEYDIPLLEKFTLPQNITDIIPQKLIREYACLPIPSENSDELILVTAWLPNVLMNRWIYAVCGKTPTWKLGLPSVIQDMIDDNLGVGSGSLEEETEIHQEFAEDDETEENKDAAIIRFVNEIILKALEERATDIHFEPQKNALQIRYRIDGELIVVKLPENLVRFQSAIISRLKIMARLNISEKRRPQDGRIRFTAENTELDIRLSSLQTMYGESISLRLLHQGAQPLSLTEIGVGESDLKKIESSLKRPHGIILVTGPTGSGKSTTLSAFVRRIRKPQLRIMTVEDPVEYEIEGVNQTQVQAEIGLTFASALRHILRQDPDVIMIGEIRDRETADIAIRAAMTGHLVLSSLHTNDAAGAITRLVDMGIEPFLVASSVELILAQRLVHKLCQVCAQPAKIEKEVLELYFSSLKIPLQELQQAYLIKAAPGCEHCNYLGFRGRIGIFEILTLSEEIHRMILMKESSRKIREFAISQGMKSIQKSGWEQVKKGLTSLEAILKFAESEEY